MTIPTLTAVSGVAIVAAIPIVVACWSNFKNFFTRLKRFFIVEVVICDQKSIYGLRKFLSKEFKITVGESYLFGRVKCINNNNGNMETPLFRTLPPYGFMRKGFKFIFIRNNYRLPESWGYQLEPRVSFLRWTFPVRYFPDNAIKYADDIIDNREERFKIENVRGTRFANKNDLQTPSSNSDNKSNDSSNKEKRNDIICLRESVVMDGKLEDYCLDAVQKSNVFQVPENCQVVIDELKKWKGLEKWYRERGITWKRGVCLTSSPGNGKTSLVRHVCSELNIPIYSFDLASMNNVDLVKLWEEKIMPNTPCTVLIEDIDGVFEGRENITNSICDIPGVTFDCLLRCIDGIQIQDGVLLFITTNHPEKLDCALSCGNLEGNGEIASRPGRIDRMVVISNPSLQAKKNIAVRIIGEKNATQIEQVLNDSKDDTAAQFQERCTQVALKNLSL